MKTNVLVTGRPGVGKTTVIVRVLEQVRGALRIAGFTTSEVRDPGGVRLGFQIRTTEGREAELARVAFKSPLRIGRYGVNLDAIDRLALPELARRDVDLIVVDEIGKMECALEGFRKALVEALDSPINVLGTLGVARLPFFEALRQRPDVELIGLTERNRDVVTAELCARYSRLRA